MLSASSSTRTPSVTIALAAALLAVTTAWPADTGDRARPGPPSLQIPCGECPYLYGANPAHPEISSQGLRDREYSLQKPEGTTRILVLGDSVTFGTGVARAETFPKRLERSLRRRGLPVEVMNAGVNGYTAYNELHYYLDEMRRYDPDLVVLAVVLNDAVNPRLHWGVYSENPRFTIPREAIPNAEDDRVRLAGAARSQQSFDAHVQRSHAVNRGGRKDEQGRRWPVYLTGEDSIGIDTLLDYDSPEWGWLRGLYDSLKAGVERDGASLVLLLLPLAYQLDVDYPFDPQPLFARYCRERKLRCLDLLPAFRARAVDERLFIGEEAGYQDVWHLTPAGHELVARELEGLLDDRATSGARPEAR
jgi:lysophospholipase L1-like esterase